MSTATDMAPRITANRSHLSNEHPSVGFTIYTGGKPFFEVIMATEPMLFDPANELKRNAHNYYAGRREHGLLPTSGGEAVYLLPTPALNALLAGSPRPRHLYYLTVGYDDAKGAGPVPSHRTYTDGGLPSIQIRGDFETHSMAAALGIGLERLVLSQAVTYVSPAGAFSLVNATVPASDEDRDGEDGYSFARRNVKQASYESSTYLAIPFDASEYWNGMETQESAPYGESYGGGYAGNGVTSHANGHATPSGNGHAAANGYAAVSSNGYGAVSSSGYAAYSDGFGALDDEPEERSYSAPHSEPAALLADDPDYDGHSDGRHDIGEPVTLAVDRVRQNEPVTYGYGDEADGSEFGISGRGLQTGPSPPAVAAPGSPQPLTVAEKMRILDRIARHESASAGAFAAVNRDTEFASLRSHAAYQRYHIGLSYGLVQFTQDSGSLGHLLQSMRRRDAAAFDRIFALPDYPQAPAALIELTTRTGVSSSQSPNGRSARVQPLYGHDLWEEPWVSRFIQAGAHPQFQAAQYEVASHLYIDPMLQLAGWFGLNTDRALTLVADRAINMGVDGANTFLANAVGPLKTEPMRQQALAALGYTNILAFQTATPGLKRDGSLGPMTHAAMTNALRRIPNPPVSLPPLSQMLDDIVRAASGHPFGQRVSTLRQGTDYNDTIFALI